MPDEHKEKSVYERHGRVVIDCVNERLMCRCPDEASAEMVHGALMLVSPLPSALIKDPLFHEVVFAAAMIMRGGTHAQALKYITEFDITDGDQVINARNDRPESAVHSDDLAPGRERKVEQDRQEQRYRDRREQQQEDEGR